MSSEEQGGGGGGSALALPAQLAAAGGGVPHIDQVNVSRNSRMHIGPKFVSVTQNVHRDRVVKGRVLGLVVETRGGAGAGGGDARRLRCSVFVFVCWALVVTAALAAYVARMTLAARPRRIDIGINATWYMRRGDWQAMPEYAATFQSEPARFALVGHTATAPCSDRYNCTRSALAIQRDHQRRGWSDIGPNYLVGGAGDEGLVLEGRGAGVIGAMVKSWNERSVSLMWVGNYQRGRQAPTTAQLHHVRELLSALVAVGVLHPQYTLLGHCQVVPWIYTPGVRLLKRLNELDHWEPRNVTACLEWRSRNDPATLADNAATNLTEDTATTLADDAATTLADDAITSHATDDAATTLADDAATTPIDDASTSLVEGAGGPATEPIDSQRRACGAWPGSGHAPRRAASGWRAPRCSPRSRCAQPRPACWQRRARPAPTPTLHRTSGTSRAPCGWRARTPATRSRGRPPSCRCGWSSCSTRSAPSAPGSPTAPRSCGTCKTTTSPSTATTSHTTSWWATRRACTRAAAGGSWGRTRAATTAARSGSPSRATTATRPAAQCRRRPSWSARAGCSRRACAPGGCTRGTWCWAHATCRTRTAPATRSTRRCAGGRRRPPSRTTSAHAPAIRSTQS